MNTETSQKTDSAQKLGVVAGSPPSLVIPRAGDEWTWKHPGKPRRKKIIDHIVFTKFASGRKLPVVYTRYNPKGRPLMIRVKWMLKHGRRLSTEAERATAWEATMRGVDARLSALENNPHEPRP